MSSPILTVRRVAALWAVAALLAATQLSAMPAALAQGYVSISGSGSTWSLNALEQWRRNVDKNYGIQVNFSG